MCVPGSESYANYREHLLPWEECEPLIPEYCRELGFPDNEVDFVKGYFHLPIISLNNSK